MGYRIKSGALLALITLTPVLFSQRVVPHPEPRIEPRLPPDIPRDSNIDGAVRTELRPGRDRSAEIVKRIAEERDRIDSIHKAAAAGNWSDVFALSDGVNDAGAQSDRLQAARNLYEQAARARLRGNWDDVHSLLQPLTVEPQPLEDLSPRLGSRLPDLVASSPENPFEAGPAKPRVALGSDLHTTLATAKRLYGQASGQLAERALNSGDPRSAVPLFNEAFTLDPPQSAQSAANFKKAIFSATTLSYKQRDWKAAQDLCDEIGRTHFFPVTAAEREAMSLVASRSANWLQAAQLPRTTLVVDYIQTGTNSSYFQVFGSGTVDVLVKAATIQGLLAHPDFATARHLFSQGADMLLTPEITRRTGWEDALRRDLPRTTVLSDPYIGDAAKSLLALQNSKLAPSDFDLAILLPKNDTQQAAMGLKWTDAQRNHAWQSAEFLKSNARGAPLITQSANRTGVLGWATDKWGTDSKKAVLDSLMNRQGVVILFAHGDRDGIYTPEGQKLAVQDVLKLDLRANHPIVLLLSCEGNAHAESPAASSIAQALKKSGATAVWSYGQKVDAGEAASAAARFLELIGSGKSALDSFRLLSRDTATKSGPPVHLKVRLERALPNSFTPMASTS